MNVTTAVRDKVTILLLFFVVLALFVLFWLLSRSADDEFPGMRSTPVSVTSPQIRDLRKSLVVSAVLEAGSTVVISPKVGGTVQEILVVEGSLVSRGDLLARIDPEPYRLEMEAAESLWRLAEAGLTRTKQVFESAGASMQQIDEMQTQRDSAHAKYELAKIRFGYTNITSPVSGSVLYRYMDSGNTVSPQSALFTIGNTETPQARAQIPEKYWKQFQRLEAIRVLLSFPAGGDDSVSPGKIIRIGPSINPKRKKFEVLCVPDQSGSHWPIGASLQVEFILSERLSALSLPLRALDSDNGLWRVNPADNTITRVEAPMMYKDASRFMVPEIWAAEIFVLEGRHRLKEGQTVEYFESDKGEI